MKVSLNWLQEYIDISLPLTDLANRLTLAGFEVKGMQATGGGWKDVVISQITAVDPHPNADRLKLTTVDLSTRKETVVCGAPNLNTGDKVAFACVGAQLIDPDSGQLFRLKSVKIRGISSSGMVCSERELGISDSHQGIMVLPNEAPVGTPLADYLGDTILDLEITPNRPDCLSIIGIAREIAALTGGSLRLPHVSYEETAPPIEKQVSVAIASPELCPRYGASLLNGVKIAPSPLWMRQRLSACGMRPINNIVDITNYVMLEYGQPLHAFDYHRIKGSKIIVRRAGDKEAIVTLDGVERALSQEMLVISDEEEAVAIAGVMGGGDSEVTEDTSAILLEAANFSPASIHYTGRVLNLPSEACSRFERGIRPELVLPALKRASQLITQLAGGKAAKGVIDVYPGKQEDKPIRLSADRVKRLLGVDFSLDEITRALTSLGFDCQPSGVEVVVTAPYWRSDIKQAVDLVEEVARIIGYDRIPATMLSQPLPKQNPEPIISLKQKIRHSLTGYGFQEGITYSLTGLETLKKLLPSPHPLKPTPLRMANPMTADQEYLRPSLRPNLLIALEVNRKHEEGSIRFFELGRIYQPRPKDLPDEPEMVCGLVAGQERWWQGEGKPADFFDIKGVVESLLNNLEVAVSFEASNDEGLHPGQQASVVVNGSKLGIIGAVHPKVLEAFNISEAVYLFEIDVTALLSVTVGHKMFQPIPCFPATVRDMALVVDEGINHQQLQALIESFPLVSRVTVFDVYSGRQVPPGKKSFAYHIVYQSPSHTLTDEEVNQVQQQILDRLSQELGARLRS